ncbi:MAG: ATP-dependent Clp protease ATP-binding subunit [Clostridiales bacterium]|nr:ATP-dependent Clp protease ATP-binding subunit [Clostridiales bacterium]
MDLCARCHKRYAVVYIQRIENNETKSEGICLKCAKELGIKPIDEMMSKMGINEEDIDRLDDEMEGLIASGELLPDEDGEGRAPAVDFSKIFGGFGSSDKKEDTKKDKTKKNKEPKKKFLTEYCLDLTKKARDGELDAIIGREREIGRLIQILCRRQKNNPCLIGEPGVGKTAIAEALSQRIAAGQVPYKLKDKEVHLVDLTSLVAGTQFRGQFEQRIKGLINEVKKLGNIILVIDEVHSIVGAGDAEGSMNAANILKPALSRGEIQLIGATTLAEYRKYIEKDSALERRFQPIVVEEPSVEDSINMLTGIKGYYETFHGIRIPEETVRRAVLLAERYITDRFLPDKAIDLLDEASAYLALHSPVIEELNEVVDRMGALKLQREAIESQGDLEDENAQERYRLLADCKAEELRLQSEYDRLTDQQEHVRLSDADLAQVIEIWTGIPAANITEHEFDKIDKLEQKLRERIIGQDEAIRALSCAIKRNRAGVSYKKKPVSFIFAGPTGVGKTELVKTLASELFDSPETLIRLDMSEFMEKHSVSRMIGAPPGYVGYDDAGQLTEKIRRKPYSVVLFDEIEKAHPDVMNVLLQILDDGRVTDSHGKQVNFENTVIVMTTNAGSNLNTNAAGFSEKAGANSKDRTMKALSDFLRPEFLNRVDEVITFNSLNEEDFARIAGIMLNELKTALAEKGIVVSYTEAAAAYIASESFSIKFGARNMRRFIQTKVEDEVASQIIAGHGRAIQTITIDCKEGKELEIHCI